ncbi:hypothetical protein ACIOC1_00415 [Streptomyces sp. NPDC088197]|uniref:hypothetical protein n=1 Tax=Streptomyces sp. NPDC088197 TaxID=3365840 RepID=UPI0038050A88
MTTPPPSTFQAVSAPLPPQAEQPPPATVAAVASAALEAEANPPALGEDFAVVAVPYGGQTYTVPASAEDWPLEVLESIDDDKIVIALRVLLGPKQWKRFKSTKPRTRALGELFEAVGKAAGFEGVGESGASGG